MNRKKQEREIDADETEDERKKSEQNETNFLI